MYLIVPIWPSSPLFLHLCPDGAHFRPEILAWRYVNRYEIQDGVSKRHFFTYRAGEPLIGHKRMFVMLYIDSRPVVEVTTTTRPGYHASTEKDFACTSTFPGTANVKTAFGRPEAAFPAISDPAIRGEKITLVVTLG